MCAKNYDNESIFWVNTMWELFWDTMNTVFAVALYQYLLNFNCVDCSATGLIVYILIYYIYTILWK